jgi:uncharacterized protein YjbI with pentapeptide repeats
MPKAELEATDVGSVVADKGFLSASLFQNRREPDENQVLIQINVPVGTHCIAPLADLKTAPSAYAEEAEVLFPPSTGLRLSGANPNGNMVFTIDQSTEVAKGDFDGHPFRGNQWRDGIGGGGNPKNPRSNFAAPLGEGGVRFSQQFVDANKAAATLINQGQDRGDLLDEIIRGEQKAAIAKDIAARLGDKFDDQLPFAKPDDTPERRIFVREHYVSQLISLWANTSNDSNPASLAMQEAAKDEFGLTKAANWEVDQITQSAADVVYKNQGELYRAFLRAQYESTQEYLAKGGVTELGLFRGMESISVKEAGEAPLRPLSSWAYDSKEAKTFAGDGAMLAATIPADRVLSCARTGVGCLNETEVVVLSGDDKNISAMPPHEVVQSPSSVYVVRADGDYSNGNLAGANLAGLNFTRADFTNANLTGVKFGFYTVDGTNFTGAKITDTDLTDFHAKSVNFSNADLSGSKLLGANIVDTNFAGANLGGTVLRYAGIGNSDLSGANLVGADLGYTFLSNVNFSGANLTGADLTDANLVNADLTNANLTNVKGSVGTILPSTHKVVDGFVVKA